MSGCLILVIRMANAAERIFLNLAGTPILSLLFCTFSLQIWFNFEQFLISFHLLVAMLSLLESLCWSNVLELVKLSDGSRDWEVLILEILTCVFCRRVSLVVLLYFLFFFSFLLAILKELFGLDSVASKNLGVRLSFSTILMHDVLCHWSLQMWFDCCRSLSFSRSAIRIILLGSFLVNALI